MRARGAVVGFGLLAMVVATRAPAEQNVSGIIGFTHEMRAGKPVVTGYSFRSRATFHPHAPGFSVSAFAHLDSPSGHLFALNLAAGPNVRYGSDVFVELGAGAEYSMLFGFAPLVVPAVGAYLAQRFFVTVPVSYSIGRWIYFMPYLGWTF